VITVLASSVPPPLLGPRECACVLEAVATAVFLLLGIVLPCAVLWLAERASKAAFLESRGLQLCIRWPLTSRAHGAPRPRWRPPCAAAGALAAPTVAVAAAVGVWWAALALVAALSPRCRGRL
jgi:hypothetical protein